MKNVMNKINILGLTGIQSAGAGVRSLTGIDPQWSHTIAQPAL
jgi:hypothetical protein